MAKFNRKSDQVPSIDLSSKNLEQEVTVFNQHFESYLELINWKDSSNSEIVKLWRKLAGKSVCQVIDKAKWGENEEKDDYKVLSKKLVICLRGKESKTSARCGFWNRRLGHEKFEHFVEDLKEKAEKGGYGSMAEQLIRDHIMAFYPNKKIRKELQELGDEVSLEEVIKVCKGHENKHENPR